MKDEKFAEQSPGKILRLPANETMRGRLQEKHLEYNRRRKELMRKNQVNGYGVVIGSDDNLLDAHYKEVLFGMLLKNGKLVFG